MKFPLTVAGRVAVGAGEAGGAGDALAHAVAHVAGGGGGEAVHHEARAVPHLYNTVQYSAVQYSTVAHRDVQLAHAALAVLVDAGHRAHDPLPHAGHRPCTHTG